ncbi:MAG: RES family NAD+ phosphorylase [Flavobacteriales bacterium]|nr:RES family NAD+ phosphorylase [Flavobacteriales bacterium]
MIVYRLTQTPYAGDLRGMGAFHAGGRWNTKGRPMLYCAASRSLALCEVLVHLPRLERTERSFAYTVIEFPDDATVSPSELPLDWGKYPYSQAAQGIGDTFLHHGRHVALQVPSALVPREWIFGLNPNHARRKEIRVVAIEPFTLDHRFFTSP